MNVLLLAGTAQAREIAQRLANEAGLDVIASLAGETRQPVELACKTRIGGFGGEEGFARYLVDNDIDMVIDATHPFAAIMSATAARVCARAKRLHVRLLRPEWHASAGDEWHFITSEAEVASLVKPGQTVFLATGRKTLMAYSNLQACRLICRQIDMAPGAFPFRNGEFVVGRPPFSFDNERALFSALNVDWLVVKNSGGEGNRSKLDAARALKIPVALIRRPVPPDCLIMRDVASVINWARRLKKGL